MALRRSTPLKLSPSTVCDALDSSDVPAGAMAKLANLIPDPTTKNLFQCRPASLLLNENFGLIPGAGFISTMKTVGNRIYGMVASTTVPGRDEPFCYDILLDSFIAISGTKDATTLPFSPATSGPWTPPITDVIGQFVVIAHLGYTSVGDFAGFIDISNPAAPSYTAENLTTTGSASAFPSPPVAVAAFNGRAYYMVNPPGQQPGVLFSDILAPKDAGLGSIPSNVITFDDNVTLTAFGKLGLNNQLGGIIQALIVFKGVTNMYQITGDAISTSQPLTRNALNVTTGTNAPLSVVSTPKGIMFMSPEGFRLIDTYANVSDPIGIAGTGITVPFTYAIEPSRVCAAAGGNILRASVRNGYAQGNPEEEYFYDFGRGIWTGPHTFASSLIQPYNNTFIKTPLHVDAKLFQSDVVQNATSTYTENGTALTWQFLTALFPNTDQMCQNNMVETTIHMALTAASGLVACFAQDQDGTVLDSVSVPSPGTVTLWGQFQWGQAEWGGGSSALYPRQLFWTMPIVFQRLQLSAIGQSGPNVKIGQVHLRYESLGYLQPVLIA